MKTAFTELVDIDWPIIQAPMIGGISSVEMAASVSNSGALGSLAAGNIPTDSFREQLVKIKSLTSRNYAANFFIRDEKSTLSKSTSGDALSVFYKELGLDDKLLHQSKSPVWPALDEQLEIAIENSVPVVTFTFGLPESEIISQLHRHNIKIAATATTIDEAIKIEKVGCDAIILQGIEAGGHRGSFPDTDAQNGRNLFLLLEEIKDKVSIPIIAAGGIMDGAMIASCIKNGAAAAQLGTAFLFTEEAGVDEDYLKAISSTNTETCLTKGFTGKYARVLKNRFTDEMENKSTEKFPLQAVLTAAILKKAKELGRTDLLPYWAGKSVTQGRKGSSKWLVNTLIRELEAAL